MCFLNFNRPIEIKFVWWIVETYPTRYGKDDKYLSRKRHTLLTISNLSWIYFICQTKQIHSTHYIVYNQYICSIAVISSDLKLVIGKSGYKSREGQFLSVSFSNVNTRVIYFMVGVQLEHQNTVSDTQLTFLL